MHAPVKTWVKSDSLHIWCCGVGIPDSCCQIVQSLAIMFNFLLTAFLGLSRFRCDLAVVVLCIMTGVALSSYGDTDFNELGFMCALGSALMAAVRWVVTQKLLVATAQLDNGVAASSTMAVVPSSGGSEPEDRGSCRHGARSP